MLHTDTQQLPFLGPRRLGSLARHLLITYVVLTLITGALLWIGSLWAIDSLEARLQRIDMGMAVSRIRDDLLAGHNVERVGRFFHGRPHSDAFPGWLRQAPLGFSKLTRDGKEWHVLAQDYHGETYILLRDYTAFEEQQSRTHWIAACGMACTLLLAYGLGALTTRRLVGPLIRLAAHVGTRASLPPQTKIAIQYPDNEIGNLAEAFDRTYNQLEAALTRERLFTADVGHELRTPMMVISSPCEVMLDTPALAEEQRAGLQRIQTAAKDVHEQLTAYLMLSRDHSNADRLPRSDIVSVATDEVDRLLPRARKAGMILECQAIGQPQQSNLPRYPIALLRIVLSNLVRNAIQHAAQASHIVVEAAPNHIVVFDDGHGIAPALRAHLFTPFVPGPSSGPDNLGLGLSLVQRICQHQRWQLSVTSSRATGTRFHIVLPTEHTHDLNIGDE